MLVAVGLELFTVGDVGEVAGRSPSVGGGGATSLEVINRNTLSKRSNREKGQEMATRKKERREKTVRQRTVVY